MKMLVYASLMLHKLTFFFNVVMVRVTKHTVVTSLTVVHCAECVTSVQHRCMSFFFFHHMLIKHPSHITSHLRYVMMLPKPQVLVLLLSTFLIPSAGIYR